jgi:protein-ribulosamine 3-kinase
MQRFAAIGRELSALSGAPCAPAPERSVAGGSINECYAWRCGARVLFVKVGARAARAAFEAESLGLAELTRARAIRVPRVIACGQTEAAAFLALEWIEARAADARCEERLGEGLAALHAVTAVRFGFHQDNLIGRTPQANGWTSGWAEFFRDRRLRPQLTLAAQNAHGAWLMEPGERLLELVPALLAGHRPSASLLHGDLWGGNWLASAEGEPVVFDPAVYYGDREADLAMTHLFGGFKASFYRAYGAAAPLAPGWEARGELYNLYHVLNHANLFGAGYARQAQAMMARLLARHG